jgi:hypothetical protein
MALKDMGQIGFADARSGIADRDFRPEGIPCWLILKKGKTKLFRAREKV